MVKIQVVFYVLTPRSVVIGYQRFGGHWCFLLHDQDSDSKDPPKRCYHTVKLLGVTTQKTLT